MPSHNITKVKGKKTIRRRCYAASSTNKQPKMRTRTRSVKKSRSRTQTGGASGCNFNTNYAPYDFDSFNRWRGNPGGSVPVFGSTVPQNVGQRFANWFDGKTTLFNPSPFDSTSQTKVQYQSQVVPTPTSTSSAPSVSSIRNRPAQRPGLFGKLSTYFPFASSSDKASFDVNQMTPMKRGGGRKTGSIRLRKSKSNSQSTLSHRNRRVRKNI